MKPIPFLSRAEILLFIFIQSAALLYTGLPILLAQNSSAGDKADKSLSVLVGQMIMIGFPGTGIDDPGVSNAAIQLKQGLAGGVILFSYNIHDRAQVVRLNADLRKAAGRPVFIAIDEEGGQVTRLTAGKGFRDFPSALDVAGTYSRSGAYRVYAAMAGMVKEAGFNMNLGPVVDLNLYTNSPVIGALGRSYSGDPELVVSYAAEFIRAHDSQGIITAVKHFPGHGSSRHDTHVSFSDVTSTWREIELDPYRRLLSSNMVRAVMSSHVYHSGIDSRYPASLSSNHIQGLLRQGLGFQGLVLSDDLQMDAVFSRYSLEEIVVQAVNSGTDILIFGNFEKKWDPEVAGKAVNIIKRALADGRIKPERIKQALDRINKVKNNMSGPV